MFIKENLVPPARSIREETHGSILRFSRITPNAAACIE
jgi:hypothetical protein